jgi:hypothetical protein
LNALLFEIQFFFPGQPAQFQELKKGASPGNSRRVEYKRILNIDTLIRTDSLLDSLKEGRFESKLPACESFLSFF